MANQLYRVSMYCPITKVEEEVFFYENEEMGKLVFNGCDHQFNQHNCECANCCEEAYQKLIQRK